MSQYEHLFVKDMPDCMPSMRKDSETGEPLEYRYDNLGEGLWLMNQDLVPGSKVSMTHIWIHETTDPQLWVNQHQHETDEILIFTGSNPDDPHDLGAEVYLEIEGERHTITRSGAVYIPAGTKHCPLGWNRIDRPFRFSALLLAPEYRAKD
ncbi:hypothetical protein JSO19_07915 [Leucobacter sp. UCMA 4100]|uniref:hypothetical protein n=1 Tax=Leucobacter sp. UCMA 4100 TaxID=2810534 RepID=UPI0022EB2656|nr:hypothetical protein [Leucobacter sp. UCMA 4100]MDA3147305.1 hypothetical protein [Leucobacter sp. UCMA 4100]